MRKPPDWLLERLGRTVRHDAEERALAEFLANPPDTMTMTAMTGERIVYRLPKVRRGQRRR